MALTGHHLKVALRDYPPLVSYRGDFEGLSGPGWEMFSTIAERLNFTYTLVQPPDGLHGNVLNNGTITGMVGMAHRKEVDFAIGFFGISVSRDNAVDFSTPTSFRSYNAILLPRPTIEPELANFLNPFNLQLWIGIIGTLIVITLLGGLLDSSFFVKDIIQQSVGNRKRGFFFQPFWVARVFTSNVVEVEPSIFSGKVYLGVLFVVNFFLSAAYSALLISLLAAPRVKIPVNSLKDLVEYGKYPWAAEIGGYQIRMFKEAKDDSNRLFREVGKKIQTINDCTEDSWKVIKENMALICSIEVAKTIIGEEYRKNGSCGYYIAKERINPIVSASVFPRNSPYKKLFNKWIGSLRESGVIEKRIRDATNEVEVCDRKPGWRERNKDKIFSMKDLGGIFLLLIAGTIGSFCVFLLELIVFKLKKTFAMD